MHRWDRTDPNLMANITAGEEEVSIFANVLQREHYLTVAVTSGDITGEDDD